MKRIAIFASGNGSNAECIAKHFSTHPDIRVSLILANRADAYVLQRAKNLGIPSVVFGREEFYNSGLVLGTIQDYRIDFIVLAGFLWLVPGNILRAYPNRVLNIHPALLPKYGGKGMFGSRVHQAVIDNKETETGISIHRVNEKYDEGQVIFQKKVPVHPADTAESIASRVHELEYKYFPVVIEQEVGKLQ